jgi:glycogen operon protein
MAKLRGLGVTAVELMPVHQRVTSRHLADAGLSDYWGYSTMGFFAPDPRFAMGGGAPGDEVVQFKGMVKRMHAAGLEVIIDVVYNHTPEGNHLGPTLGFKGIDNATYYRLAEDKRYAMDFTGTGNTINVPAPQVLQLVMDSLRRWANEFHVDGFRFDLAPSLAREESGVSQLAAFFKVLRQDPVLSPLKLIAEPWDVGDGGYQVGRFPAGWSEWNGSYRDLVRRAVRGDGGCRPQLAARLLGSADLYQGSGKAPTASVNFVTSHDGFSLRDLVSFNDKRNAANREDNKDGDQNNHSWNCGYEGLDAPEDVRALRGRQERNFFATLLLSQGVPMLRAGDERLATQQGNNNAYCQDNELSWLAWELGPAAQNLSSFVQGLIAFRRAHPVFRQPRYLTELPDGVQVVSWVGVDGKGLTEPDWAEEEQRTLGLVLDGTAMPHRTYEGEPIVDQAFLVWFNLHHDPVQVTLPGNAGSLWRRRLDTADEPAFVQEGEKPVAAGTRHSLVARSVVVFERLEPRS